MTIPLDLDNIRRQFPALDRSLNGQPVVFLDGAAGSQVPSRVAAEVSRYLLSTNANHGGPFASSVESDAVLEAAHGAAADFLGAADPHEVAFGANMTTITLAVSRALARDWRTGDRLLVSKLDHDANVTPWLLAAEDARVEVDFIEIDPLTGTLDLDSFHQKLGPHTRLVAVGAASNLTGSVNPITEITSAAHAHDALVFVDAVHFAPHRLIDVEAWGCDFLSCSAYKFFGPHVGLLWGRRDLLESTTPYKLRPCTDELPGRWMTGTANHEGIAGVAEAIEYLADLGRSIDPDTGSRRDALVAAYTAIGHHEQQLSVAMLEGLTQLPDYTLHGLAAPDRLEERVATFSITHQHLSPDQLARSLADDGIFAWPGNHYALPATEALGLEPHGTLRLSPLHYNTLEEIHRTLGRLHHLSDSR